MTTQFRHILLPLLFLLFTGTRLLAQNGVEIQQDTQKLKIEGAMLIENYQIKDRTKQKLSGNVRLRQENTIVRCDTAILDGDDARLKGNVVIEQGDSVKVFADSAHYRADTKISKLFGNVVLVNAKQKIFTERLDYDMGNKIATYHNGATLENGKSQLTSKHGYYHVNTHEVFFKGDVLVTDPEFTMRTDTMNFNTETQLVRFVAPTLISQRKGKIYTEGGFYDIENDFAEFDLNPEYEREGQKGKADKMRYSGLEKQYVLEGNAQILEGTKQTEADVIRYNTLTEETSLHGHAHARDSVRDISGEDIRYNEKTKNYELSGRGRVNDPPNFIEADTLQFNDQLGNGLALGRVIWIDTSGQYTILAHRMDYNKKTEYLQAYGGFGPEGAKGRPLMKSVIDTDTLYMAADTLVSFKPDSAADDRLLLAHRDVRIFKSDLQAVCDSLSFSTVDSIFWFYKIQNTPLIWSDTSQFFGDTVKILLKDKKLDRIWLRQNSWVINSEDEVMFNQIKGRNITAYFKDDAVNNMLVEGNAEALYYALDDGHAYIGLNETACSEMRLYFDKNQVDHIKFYNEPSGKFVPMQKAGKDPKKLEGFLWDKERRPRRVIDIL